MRVGAERSYAARAVPVPGTRAHAVVGWPATVTVAVVAGGLFAIHLGVPAFFDNEGRYAEVAREMLLRRDWVTPTLDFHLFLNKPPLAFWLTALVFRVCGIGEWGRLVPVAGAVIALLATGRLGAALYGELAGLVASVALASMLGFVLEARTLRPDMILIASVVVAMLCWQHARRADEHRSAWLAGLYAALSVGVLAKGAVVPVIVALPVVIVTVQDSGWRGLATLRPLAGLLLVAAIVLPWHVATALEHPGFAWDYVVNQHLLFFLDRKFPRDSNGDPLLFFWAAYTVRAIPWILLLPLTLREAVRGRTPTAAHTARATFGLWLWIAAVMLPFSATPARLEHYSLPALPAAALLAARAWQQLDRGPADRASWLGVRAVACALAVVGAGLLIVARPLLATVYWIAQVPALRDLALPAGAALLGAALVLMVATRRRHAGLVVVGLLAGAVPLAAVVLRAEADVEPLFSWRPVAGAIAAGAPPDVEIVFEAPEEYQLVAGLAFYTGRQITLIAAPGYVPPGYLAGRTDGMFVARAEVERRWRSDRPLVFVSDPLQRRDSPVGLVPEPFRVLGRFGDRWVLANAAASPPS